MKERLFSVLYMFVLALVFTSVVGAVNWVSRERIRLNQEIALQRIVLSVLDLLPPEAISKKEMQAIFRRRIRSLPFGDRTVYVAVAPEGDRVEGYAFPVSGPGFWGPIYGMVAVDAQVQKILGIAFYRHSETPGLGGRITEAWFREQFRGKPLHVPSPGRRFFYLKPAGTATGPDEVDAITGATETSRRLEAFLDQELKRIIPLLRQQRPTGNV
ncbi:Na+-transporting NADH:ubiquinone oxidoreductase subunit C [Desulfacinum hydrothermale DSM 13146]|uniref:Na+-transporting NADH:ubiquinone oxidoreductase subunit C n=1 Tax=Desulfacinum hydrothermale DSM 13146 TaxID=1121390 RepID=A0A1W1XPH7_9BACT|nr:FMN-binding protein [Desulfacinum hydrothermale]SMC25869.1 Na+-transporting NADH:ubiquinone oxidoreductase subunit C [Desulfacinum hydrothermale DSM 13146]